MADDFESLMASMGVQKLGKPSRKHTPQAPTPAPGGARPAVRKAIVPVQELDEALAERDAARREGAAQARRSAELAQELATARAEIARLQTEAVGADKRLAEAVAQVEGARDAAEERAATLQSERDKARGEVERLRTRVAADEQARTSLADALLERGCADTSEMLEVLNGLLLLRPRDFLDSIELADPQALARVLNDRVAFVARGVPFDVDKSTTVVVRVPKERCEICGGSDISASFHGFVQACLDSETDRITIVGGSPAYRKQLRALAAEHDDAPDLNLVSGSKRRDSRKAKNDLRNSDLVVIWGGTILDHSVSAAYAGGPAPIVTVNHRGISGMLQQVRSVLRRGSS